MILCFATIHGCRAVTGPDNSDVGTPSFTVVQDYRLVTPSCDQINKAISFLENLSQPQCRELGATARGRFSAEEHHQGRDDPQHNSNSAYPTQNACTLG